MAKRQGKPEGKRESSQQRMLRVARQTEQRRELEARFKQATRYFRPRKTEKQSIVFVSAFPETVRVLPGQKVVERYGKKFKVPRRAKTITIPAGQRLPRNSRKKGFTLYVTRDGKLKPYKDRDKKRQPPIPLKQGATDVRVFKRKRAERRWYAEHVSTGELKQRKIRPRKGKREVSFSNDIVPKIAGDLKQMTDNIGQGYKHLVVRAAISVEVKETGEKRTIQVEEDFKQGETQLMKRTGFYAPFVEKKFYAAMANQLAAMGMVTTGSAQFVGRMRENRGKSRRQWTKRGMKWDKWDFKEVKILGFDTGVKQIKLYSR